MSRIITAAIALPVLIASILYPPLELLFVVVAVAAIVVALYEFWFLARRVGAKPDVVVGYAATAALLVAFFYNEPIYVLLIIPALVIAALAAEMLRGAPFDKMILSVGSTVLGVVGDLTESALKRGAKAKDAAQILPGHGGFLDRLDSLLFNAPLIYYFALYYWR